MALLGLGIGAARVGLGALWGLAKRPVLGGAIIGGAQGYFGSDRQSGQLRLEEGAMGALQGAVGGLLLAKAPGMLWRNKGMIAGGAWSATKMAAKAGRFALENPLLVGGIAGAGYIASQSRYATGQSPTLNGVKMNTSIDQQNAAAYELTGGMGSVGGGAVGAAATMMGPYQQSLADSTTGLVQGLYRSRHG